MGENTVLSALAREAKHLTEAELRTLLEIVRQTFSPVEPSPDEKRKPGSSRQIADATGQGRKTVQAAIDTLQERRLITSDGGSATRAATFRLKFLAPVPPVPGVAATPPPEEICGKVPEQVALFQRHPPTEMGAGGVPVTPPLASEERHPGVTATPPLKENARARTLKDDLDLDSEAASLLDRSVKRALQLLRAARSTPYDAAMLEKARNHLWGFMAKFGPLPDPHPPREEICREFLACGEWRELEGLLTLLRCDRRRPEVSYGWFPAVAMEKLQDVPPEALKEARRRLRMRVVAGGKHESQSTAAVAPSWPPLEDARSAEASVQAQIDAHRACAEAEAHREREAERKRAVEAQSSAIRAAAAGKGLR